MSAAAATHLAVTAPGSVTAGSGFAFTVTAEDQFNNTAQSYTRHGPLRQQRQRSHRAGQQHADGGVGTFSATLKTAGSQTLTATDTVNTSITGASGTITVSAAAATHFVVSAPSTATAGTASPSR